MEDRWKVDRKADLDAEKADELGKIARQQQSFRDLAAALERGELPVVDAQHGTLAYVRVLPVPHQDTLDVLALLCRQKADAILPARRPRARPRKLYDPGMACFMVHERRVYRGMNREDAIGEVAELFGMKDDRTLGKEYDARLSFVQQFYPAINKKD